MDRRIFHGNITPDGLAQSLLAEFNRGNLRAQVLGRSDSMAVQIGTHPGAMSGGQTALTVTIQKAPDGIIVQLGQQAWMGTAASLGWTALTALRNPFSLLGRLDDLAQDIENLQLSERVWQVIERAVQTAGASTQLSERMRRVVCDYCNSANPVGEAACLSCGAPLGNVTPTSCKNCGFVVLRGETKCPNCGMAI